MSKDEEHRDLDSPEIPPPTPLPAGWYADPEGDSKTSLRYWDGDEWTEQSAVTTPAKRKKSKTGSPGSRRSRVVLTTALLASVTVGAAGLGIWNMWTASVYEEQAKQLDDQIGTVKGEIDELNE